MRHYLLLLLSVATMLSSCNKDYYLEDLNNSKQTIEILRQELLAEASAKMEQQNGLEAQQIHIHELNLIIESLQGDLSSTQEDLEDKVVQIVVLEDTITSLNGQAETLIAQVDAILEQADADEELIAELNTQIAELQEEVNERIIEYVEVVNTITEVVTVEVPVVETVTEIITLTVTQTVIVDNTDYTTIEAQIAEINGHLATIDALRGIIEELTPPVGVFNQSRFTNYYDSTLDRLILAYYHPDPLFVEITNAGGTLIGSGTLFNNTSFTPTLQFVNQTFTAVSDGDTVTYTLYEGTDNTGTQIDTFDIVIHAGPATFAQLELEPPRAEITSFRSNLNVFASGDQPSGITVGFDYETGAVTTVGVGSNQLTGTLSSREIIATHTLSSGTIVTARAWVSDGVSTTYSEPQTITIPQ